MKYKRNKITYTLTAFIATVLLILSFMFGGVGVTYATSAYVDEDKYTNVLEDLQKDEDFSVDDYPSKENDYTLQVVQIAESEDKELFIYVYQPSTESMILTATSINISTAINDSLKYFNYSLTLLNTSGTLAKYLVNDFVVKDDALRYYDISSIFRVWNEDIDSDLPIWNENDIDEVSFEVGELWTATTVNDTVSYNYESTEVVTITSKYVGYIRYANGFFLCGRNNVDGWYVAFSCDYDITHLYEADLLYKSYDYSHWFYVPGGEGTSRGDIVDNYVSLTDIDTAVVESTGIFGHSYSWSRIQSVTDFISSEDLTDEAKVDMVGMQWVLRFAETNFSTTANDMGYTIWSTVISEVTILRLSFEVNGQRYNLGVVDNRQSPEPGQSPDNNFNDDIFGIKKGSSGCNGDMWSLILTLILTVLLLVLLAPFLPVIINVVVWIVMLPFRLIGAVFKGFKKDKKRKKE